MQKLTQIQVLQEYAKLSQKYILYISFWLEDCEDPFNEVIKAAPYLNFQEDAQIFMDGCGVIICDTEEECKNLFWQTVGDDGPTKLNPYNGPVKVYALTIFPDGQLYNENT